jgi:hypothetical protein
MVFGMLWIGVLWMWMHGDEIKLTYNLVSFNFNVLQTSMINSNHFELKNRTGISIIILAYLTSSYITKLV